MNELIAFESKKKKKKKQGIISACCTSNGMVHIKKTERSKAKKKIYLKYELLELFPDDVNLDNKGGEGLFHNASQDANNSTQSRY